MATADEVAGAKVSKGVVLALLSAFFYASYLVLVKHKSDTEEKVDIPLFFGTFLQFSPASKPIESPSSFRFCRIVEFAADVARIFCIEFYTNRSIRTAEPTAIPSIIFERLGWNSVVRGALAVVLLSHVVPHRHDRHHAADSTCDAIRRCLQA